MFNGKDNATWFKAYLEQLKQMDKSKGRCKHCKYRRRCI